MKNRKRILAFILAGFMSVTTAFQATSTVAFATEGVEVAVEAASEVSSVEETVEVAESEDKKSEDESSKEAVVDEAVAGDTVVVEEEVKTEEKTETEAEVQAQAVITPIKEVREKASGDFTVKGVVTYVNGSNVYVQDDTAAICLYDKALSSAKVGNLVTATGTFADYNGLSELKSLKDVVIDTANTVSYAPVVFEAAQLAELVNNHDNYECQVVLVNGVTIKDLSGVAKGNVKVSGGDAEMLVYDKSNAAKIFADFKEGDVVNIKAVVGDYMGGQLLPLSVEAVGNGGTEEPQPIGDVVVDDSTTLTIASFAGTNVEAFNGDLVLYADGATENDGANKEAEITSYKSNTQTSPIYSFDSNGSKKYIIGSTGLKKGDYYLITVPGSGYGLYKISFSMRGSNTGAKNWVVSYSADGENFSNIGDKFEVSTTWADYTFSVPAEVKHVDKVYFRVGPADDTSIKGATVGTGGANRFNSIKVDGSPVFANDIVAPVEVLPEAGEVPTTQELTMSTQTSGATIYYSVNGADFAVYDDANKPVLMPEDFVAATENDAIKKAIVDVYATKEGLKDSVKKEYVYTPARVATVKASPNGGAIRKSAAITLKTATEGAKIEYSLDKGETWVEYKDPFKLKELPATVMAKATCENYEDSVVATFEFTERVNEEYNIYFGQLHSHTSYSDGAGTCEEAFNHAANEVENLDFLAVTDHSNSFDNDTSATITDGSCSSEWKEGHELADKYTSNDFVGLYGYEMTWSGGAPGHMNTFNTGGFMSRNMAGYESKSRVALQNYYAQLVNTPESISMFNHPGTTFGDFYDFAYYTKANDQQITLIEVGNGEGAIGSAGYFPSYEYYTRALDKGWHIAPANNQDNHKGRWGDANTGRTVILADSLTRENIYDAIRNMRVYATEDNDLSIYYTFNGVEMGTILDEKPSEAVIKVKTSDPTDSSTMTVEVIANGGKVVASAKANESSAETTFTFTPNDNYYYIRITQADGNIAVTAPVWTSDVEAVGIGSITTETALPVAGESLSVKANFYNNEASDFEVTSITYNVSGEVIRTVELDENTSVIKSQSEFDDVFEYTCNEVGKKNIEVTLTGYLNGVPKKYTASMDVVYVSPDMVTHVVVDASHLNDYVAGYYAGNVGNFADIAAKDYVKVDIVKTEITKETLENASVFVISAPNRNTKYGDVMHFEDSFLEVVKEYVANGGNLIVCGIADYQDTKDCQTSVEINKLLEAVGATTRLNSDEIVDEVKNGGQEYRLYFNNHNRDCYLTKGVTDTQTYSAYSACSVRLDEAAVAAGKAEAIVYGHETTYTKDCKQFDDQYVEVPKGSVVAAAREQLTSGSDVIITGTVFLSNFEVKSELDYGGQEYYSNRNILLNFLEKNKKEIAVSTIAELRAGEPGQIFTVEGYVTAGTAVEGNKFFDTIYIQDETAGTTVFPIADAGIELGTKVRVTGFVDGYQGDKEIQIYNYKVLDAEKKVIEPKKVTTKEAADYNALGGSLLKVEGKVTRVVTNSSGVDYFYVVDESGVEARVFIDGYILASDGEDTIAEDAVVGNTVSAVGLSYYNPDGACLRVRDRAEIVLVAVGADEPDPIPDPEPEPEPVKATLVTKWGTTYYVTEDGEKLTGLQTIDGVTYFFNEKGAMQKKTFVTVDGVTYYAKADGSLAKNEIVEKWAAKYVFDENGALLTGFITFEGKDYYANEAGKLVKSGWITVGEDKYYAKSDYTLAKNETITKWFKKYTFDEKGVLVK